MGDGTEGESNEGKSCKWLGLGPLFQSIAHIILQVMVQKRRAVRERDKNGQDSAYCFNVYPKMQGGVLYDKGTSKKGNGCQKLESTQYISSTVEKNPL